MLAGLAAYDSDQEAERNGSGAPCGHVVSAACSQPCVNLLRARQAQRPARTPAATPTATFWAPRAPGARPPASAALRCTCLPQSTRGGYAVPHTPGAARTARCAGGARPSAVWSTRRRRRARRPSCPTRWPCSARPGRGRASWTRRRRGRWQSPCTAGGQSRPPRSPRPRPAPAASGRLVSGTLRAWRRRSRAWRSPSRASSAPRPSGPGRTTAWPPAR